MEENALGGHGGFSTEASDIQLDRNVSRIIRCNKIPLWEKEMEQMSSSGSRASNFHDNLARLLYVVHQKFM